MIREILENSSEHEITIQLKNFYSNNHQFSESDKKLLNEYETDDYALLGIIGLILIDNSRMLLGRLQPWDKDIRELCSRIEVSEAELRSMSEAFLNDDFDLIPEFVLRKVMIEYPKI